MATFLLVDFDKPDFALLKNFDWYGLISAWRAFSARSNTCSRRARATNGSTTTRSSSVAIVSAVSAVVFFARVLTARAPIVDLRAFANRNFAVGSLFSFVLGIGLYGLTYLYPVYLAQVRGYDALMIGETMFVSGLVMFLTAPIAGQLNRKARSAFHSGRRLRLLRRRHLADDLCHVGLGFLGTAMAANIPRRRA